MSQTKIITTTDELSKTFVSLCKKYNHIAFMTAWAGNAPVIDELYKVRKKIVMAVVGVSFFHTSPDFIEKFQNANIHYFGDITNDNGVFHPKTYLFYNSEKDWEAIIGSSNLTEGGFCNDVECNVLLSNTSQQNYKSILSAIEEYYEESLPYSEGLLQYYKGKYDKREVVENEPLPYNFSLKGISWKEYLKQLKKNEGGLNSEKVETRLALLDKAHKWLKQPLASLPDKHQLALAGLVEEYEGISDWKFFGSTIANGTFQGRFKKEEEYRKCISNALDKIPYSGEVTKKDYDAYVKAFESADIKSSKTIFSRFLAMKRPDVFVCLSSRNGGVPELVGAKIKTINPKNYWEEIIVNAQNSKWYNEEPPFVASANEKKVFKYRVAMLDALCYKPKEK